MSKHPYSAYEHHPAWEVVRKALAELEANGDLEKSTAEAYLIGFVVQALAEAGCFKDSSKPPRAIHDLYALPHHSKRPKPAAFRPIEKTAAILHHVSENPPVSGFGGSALKKISFPIKSSSVHRT